MIPLSLYVHIPWCVRKCPYCDFNSHEAGGSLPEDDYVKALLDDLAADIETFEIDRPITSIFFGGGTPSLFSSKGIGDILAGAERQLAFADDIEITLEANPGTLADGAAQFTGFRAAGINRLSIGVQSFSDHQLSELGRIHDANAARAACEFAREAGFDNFNLDLMHGLPGQYLEGALADLRQAIDQAPRHLSWYQLTIEPNTVFGKRPPVLPDEETLAHIYDDGMALLAEHGYRRYEISAFCTPGAECRHNLNYWQFGDYLGIGAGAHGKLTKGQEITRTAKTRVPKDYLSAPKRHTAAIETADLPLEFMMNALRLIDGVPLALFTSRTGLPVEQLAGFFSVAESRGLLESTKDRIKPTPLGVQFLNSLLLLVDDQVIATSQGTSEQCLFPP